MRVHVLIDGRQEAVFRGLFFCLVLFVSVVHSASGQTYRSGQNLQPVFEGWEENADGSFNMVFGYLNRNFEERLNVPCLLYTSDAADE